MRPLMLPRSASPLFILTLAFLTGCGANLFGGNAPGMRLIQSAERVWRDYGCGGRKLPFVEINDVNVTPSSVAPGGSFMQHLVYSACLPHGWKDFPARVRTRIHHEGREILTDVQPQFLIQPGRWAVDATVTTPATAQPGSYRLRIDVTGAAAATGVTGFDIHR